MLHEFKKISVYDLKGLIRRAGLMTATVQLRTDGRTSVAYYPIWELPERYDNRIVKEYTMNLTTKLVKVILSAM